jgi:hypothetical protein
MKFPFFASALFALVSLLAGCATTNVMSPAHLYDYRAQACESKDINLASSNPACVVRALDDEEIKCYTEADSDKAKACRDKVVGITKKYVDQYWRKFVSDLYGRNAGVTTALETGIGMTAAAAAITTPKSAADILAVVATSLSALNTSLQKNFFGNQAVDLLIGQMEADRYVIDQQILNGLALSVSDYSLATAMSQLADYALAMSVPHAMQSLRQAGGKAAQEVKDRQTAAIGDGAVKRVQKNSPR